MAGTEPVGVSFPRSVSILLTAERIPELSNPRAE
jgi:hypothetical protein